ncbi:hypothetical protein [Streptomyces altiplanensis]
MAVGQHASPGEEFARCLRELTALVDTGAGWCGVFGRRDPEGMRAWLAGAELPPGDVLEALLQDLAARHGTAAAERAAVRARKLHTAAAAAHDRRPGGREALVERLGATRREQAYAAGQERELALRLREPSGGSDGQGLDVRLAWARDDHERATARCAELSARLAALDAPPPPPRERLPARPPAPGSWFRGEAPGAAGAPEGPEAAAPTYPARPGPARAVIEDTPGGQPGARGSAGPGRVTAPGRRPRGARYAGLDDDGSAVSAVPAAPPARNAAPRGARYAGMEEPEAAAVTDTADPARDTRAVAGTVAVLVRLRVQGRTGEAHVLLCEAAGWPPVRLPALAAALHHAGLGADWATLLWEVASLPPDRVAAVAGALGAAGLADDGRQLLRQGVARPAAEIAAALLALDGSGGHEREVRALAEAFVHVRTPEDVAQAARTDPRRLSPLLLDTARRVSQSRYRAVVHALRVAGAAP